MLRMGPWDKAMVKASEARQIYLDEVVNLVGQSFMSTTMRCFKCHDHKFDPLPTRDYYRMYAAFAATQMTERPAPLLDTENRQGFAQGQALVDQMLAFAQAETKKLKDKQERAARAWYEARQMEYVPEKQRERYVGLDHIEQGQSRRNERRNMGHHMFVPEDLDDGQYKRTAYQRYLKKFLRSVRGVDDNIARLIKHLDETGELDNTVLVYTADQGFMLGEHDYIDKRWMHDESLRMPFIVRHPPSVPARQRIDAIVNNVDFAPTLLEIAGARAPDLMQGRSFAPMLHGEPAPDDWPQETYYRYWMHLAHHDNPAHYGIRTKGFKLIHFYGQPLDAPGAVQQPTEPYWELYDLRTDPHEMDNVVDELDYAETLAALKRQLAALQQRVGDTPVD